MFLMSAYVISMMSFNFITHSFCFSASICNFVARIGTVNDVVVGFCCVFCCIHCSIVQEVSWCYYNTLLVLMFDTSQKWMIMILIP